MLVPPPAESDRLFNASVPGGWMIKPPTIISQLKSIWVKACPPAMSSKKGWKFSIRRNAPGLRGTRSRAPLAVRRGDGANTCTTVPQVSDALQVNVRAARGGGSRVEEGCILICYSESQPGHRRMKLLVFCLAFLLSHWIPFTAPGLVPLLSSRKNKVETENRSCSFIFLKKGSVLFFFFKKKRLWSFKQRPEPFCYFKKGRTLVKLTNLPRHTAGEQFKIPGETFLWCKRA